MNFSVCISVYKNDKSEFARLALDSMLLYQSVKPTEIVLVQDGPVSEDMSNLLDEYEIKYPFVMHVIRLDTNKGLGNALKLCVENATYDICARMDSDDICLPDRFEKQLTFLQAHPEVDIVGGQMTEFIDTPDNIIGRRVVPLDNSEIYGYMKSRCALNHVTVMFRKKSVLKVGNYQDWYWNEDYFLWLRMMKAGCVFANIPDVVVNVRSGADQYARRGGKKYFDSEIGIKKLMLKEGMITKMQYMVNYIERLVVQILMPNCIRGWVFRRLARK